MQKRKATIMRLSFFPSPVGNIISLGLTDTNRVICLEFSDNGNSQEQKQSSSMGLQNLKNRIKLLDGEIIDFSENFLKGARYKFLIKF